MYQKYGNKLMCFSPPVMLATFIIEFSFAFYVIWRYKMDTISRLVTVTLFSLGTFQLTEYMICGGLGLTHIEWARMGYASIALLPALGIHLVVALSGKKQPYLVSAAWASCAVFVTFFTLTPGAISGETCYANYAVYDAHRASILPFALYYFGWLITGTALAVRWAKQLPNKAKALHWMGIGYLTFILPTAAMNLIDPTTLVGIPSIMCGFAVMLAVVLVVRVLPNSGVKSRHSLDAVRATFRI